MKISSFLFLFAILIAINANGQVNKSSWVLGLHSDLFGIPISENSERMNNNGVELEYHPSNNVFYSLGFDGLNYFQKEGNLFSSRSAISVGLGYSLADNHHSAIHVRLMEDLNTFSTFKNTCMELGYRYSIFSSSFLESGLRYSRFTDQEVGWTQNANFGFYFKLGLQFQIGRK